MTLGRGSGLLVITTCVCALGCSDSEAHDAAADPPESSLLVSPLGEPPESLSDVGIYRDLAGLSPSRLAIAYVPGFPLWSDGGAKQRLLVLPEASSIDATDAAEYGFPVGTLFFKTFSFRTATSPDVPVPVETRLLRLTDDGWKLDAYGWNEAASEATLLELKRSETRSVLSDDGEPIEHSIPSRLECRQCHESSPGQVLGVSELQLAQSGDLAQLAERLDPPPTKPYAALPHHGPLTSQVLGYLVGNCVSCHNGSNGAASSFDLRPEVALENLIDQPTASSATAAGIRVIPGEPDESVMFAAVIGGTNIDVKDMPPLGVALRDASAVQLLADWITALGTEEDP